MDDEQGGLEQEGTIVNVGFEADLVENLGLEEAARVLKITPDELTKKLNEQIHDSVEIEDGRGGGI